MHPIPPAPEPGPLLFGLGPLGHWEILIILLVILLLFGSKLPSIARNIGRSFVEFKKGVKDPPVEEKAPDTLPRHEDEPRLEGRRRDAAEDEARRSEARRQ